MIGSIRPRDAIGPAATLSLLLALAWVLTVQGAGYAVYLYGVGLVYATATLGLHLLTNDCGDISLAHGGQVALAAFVGAHLFPLAPGPFGPIALVAGAALTGMFTGAAISVPMVKLRGLAVAVVTLLLNVAIFHFVLRFPDFVGGSGGVSVYSADWLPRTDFEAVTWLSAIVLVTVLMVGWLRRGRFGLALRAIRANEHLARSAGVPVQWYRTGAYMIAGGTAGVAGGMWVILEHGVAPSSFSEASSLLLLTLAMLGGKGSMAGPVVAAVSMSLITGLLGRYGAVVSFAAPVALLFVLIKHPGGLNEQFQAVIQAFRRLVRAVRRRAAANVDDRPATPPKPLGETALSVPPPLGTKAAISCADVDVVFGGLVAVNGAAIEVRPGEVLALVGPNGAGKTTLLNVLSGHQRPTRGMVWLDDRDITRTPAHRRAVLGLRRTFQVGGHMPAETGIEHLRLGTHVDRTASSGEVATRVALRLGLADVDLRAAVADLPAGTTRLLEIGMAIACPGKVLLLDEPTVGLAQTERESLCDTLHALAGEGLGIILVDHDTAFIRRVAHRVIALDAGTVFAQGTPESVFADPLFIAAYLGSPKAPV